MNQPLTRNSRDKHAASGINDLEHRLQARLSGRVQRLRILIQGCGIILRGFARTYYAKQVAQHAIMAETSMPILANEIEVS
jgi:hypothetical protein